MLLSDVSFKINFPLWKWHFPDQASIPEFPERFLFLKISTVPSIYTGCKKFDGPQPSWLFETKSHQPLLHRWSTSTMSPSLMEISFFSWEMYVYMAWYLVFWESFSCSFSEIDSTEVALISSILGWGLRLGLLLLGDGMGLLLPELNALPFTEDPDVFASCANVVTRFELE